MHPIQFFVNYKVLFVILHVFAVIIGMGAALIADMLFSKYIADKKIDKIESQTFKFLSSVVWAGLSVVILSGIAIFFSNPEKYMASSKFLTKMFIVLVLTVNGLLLNKIVQPVISKLNFRDTNSHHHYVRIRRFAFAFGSVSVTSWILAFVLGMLKYIPLTLPQALGVYALILIIAIGISQLAERHLMKK
jgi:uncharacterized membrane protein